MISKIATITAQFLKLYMTERKETDFHENTTKLKCLADIFAQYGGLLGKLSQMLSLNNSTINSVFADCKPYSQEETTVYFKGLIQQNVLDFLDYISDVDYNVFKAGSVGQLYKSKLKSPINGVSDIVIKIQYVGLKKQFDEDLYVVRMITKFLYNFFDKKTEDEIISKLYEELDYTIEYNNQITMYELWKDDPEIFIPKLIEPLCNKEILTSEFIQAESICDFIDNSTQEQRDKIGMNIYRFIYTNFIKHGLFYSDIHYGNFLIRNKTELIIIDFGCVNKLDDDLIENILSLQSSVMTDNKDHFFETVSKMNILTSATSQESKEYMWEYFSLQLQPQLNNNFTFTEDWLDKVTNKDMLLMKEWNLPANCAYLNKLNYGFPHVLTKLKTSGDTMKVFCDIIISCI
jgi:predicted unusual protein kinase regulating ubiquinone biosynthesis (AarF/ABC1/UbiB family)